MLAYLMLLDALSNAVCLYNAFFAIDFANAFVFIIIIMVIFKCYFSGELIALS